MLKRRSGFLSKPILVIYYSWSGATERAAQAIAKVQQADVVRLTVAADTFAPDMFATSDIAQQQLATGALPVLTNVLPNFADYATILVGGPVWSAKVATPVRSLLTHLETFTGTIAPFYTDAGNAGDYETDFAGLVQRATVKPGMEYHTGQSAAAIKGWLQAVQA